MTQVRVPLRLGRGQNDRDGHWSTRARRVKKETNTVFNWLLYAKAVRPALPCVVMITRISPTAEKNPMDHDNVVGSCKTVRDTIALWLKLDDGDPRVEWRYAQALGKPGEWAVGIEFAVAVVAEAA